MIDENIKFDNAQIGGVNLHYAYAGEGADLVVLLHGFPEFWYSWRHQLAGLSDEYTVVAPDLRGYNLSDKPVKISDYKIDKIVDDVTGLIGHLGRERAAVIGHDWGAAVAWSLARKHPEYVWKLGALQVPPPDIWRKNLTFRQALASWYMLFFQIPELPEWLMKRNDYEFLVKGLKGTAFEKGTFNDDDIAEFKKSWSEPGALTGAINYYRANVWRLFSPQTDGKAAEKIKVPTVFIYGEKDRFIMPETVKGVGEAVDAHYEEFHIPEAGHWVQQEAAETVTEILRDFLAE